MNAEDDKTRDDGRREILELLPWHAAGALSPAEAERVEAALAADPELAREFDLAREEMAGAIDINEALGRPSPKAMAALFDRIDAEPARAPSGRGLFEAIGAFFAGLGPRTLAWSAVAAALVIIVQAAVIGGSAISGLTPVQGPRLAGPPSESNGASGAFALVQFKPNATMAQVEAALRTHGATIVEGPRAGGLYRVRLSTAALPPATAAAAVERLQKDETVAVALAEAAR